MLFRVSYVIFFFTFLKPFALKIKNFKNTVHTYNQTFKPKPSEKMQIAKQ